MRRCFAIMLLFALTTELKAMDLVAAFERALQSDRQLAAARHEREAAAAGQPLARADYLPQILVSAALGCERQDQSTRDDSGANPTPARDCAEIFGAETARTENIAAEQRASLPASAKRRLPVCFARCVLALVGSLDHRKTAVRSRIWLTSTSIKSLSSLSDASPKE